MTEEMTQMQMAASHAIVEAGYLDTVVKGLRKELSRRLGRQLGDADLSTWLVCAMLDGGLMPAGNPLEAAETDVLFLRSERKRRFTAMRPADIKNDIDGKAFRHPTLGEFRMCSLLEQKDVMDLDTNILNWVGEDLASPSVKRIVLVVDDDEWLLSELDQMIERRIAQDPTVAEKQVTVLNMVPRPMRHCQTLSLGYSVMEALGVSADELL